MVKIYAVLFSFRICIRVGGILIYTYLSLITTVLFKLNYKKIVSSLIMFINLLFNGMYLCQAQNCVLKFKNYWYEHTCHTKLYALEFLI